MADLSDVIKRLQDLPTAIADALEHEVWDSAYAQIVMTTTEDVYSYKPDMYFFVHRRYMNGGLQDPDNYERTTEIVNDEVTLKIKNVTPLQNLWGDSHTEPLIDAVESTIPAIRNAYNYRRSNPYPKPYMEKVQERTISDVIAKDALANGLKRQGYDLV